jgi:hypothetical protein
VVFQPRPIEFSDQDPRPLFRHLDRWGGETLGSPSTWEEILERTGQWADYSPRNQILLASYGVVGPVAGAATWSQVPSVEPGRPVAVRAGEHGLPVRVPVTGEGEVDSARSPVGARSRSVVSEHRWELVFATEQLARRPHPDALAPVTVPPMTEQGWAEVVRQASGRLLGRRPRRIGDPSHQLAVLASRVPMGRSRPSLAPPLADQAGWLVASRVGRAVGPMPGFDPGLLQPRERWQTLVDVRLAVDRVTRAVSAAVGVELSASPLPRWGVGDDRDVAPGRRNYLSRADLAQLPMGVWVEAGPYTNAEWAARGRPAAVGRGAFLRATERSYLAVYETTGGARWALETIGSGAHRGLVAEGDARSLTEGKDDARAALRDRFPQVAVAVDTSVGAPVASPQMGWAPLPDGRDERTLCRVFDERVAAIIAPGPGGRWGTWSVVDGNVAQGPLAPTADAAKLLAEGVASMALVKLASDNPARADQVLADAAASPESWSRQLLVQVIGGRLTEADGQRLAAPNASPADLVDAMANSGVVSPATMLRVLRVEGVDANEAAALVPAIGLPMPAAINELAATWELSRLDAGALLGATTSELRAAGASAAELLAHSPREVLRRLDDRPRTWELLGPALLEAGYHPVQALRHIAAHAPTPETFAAGVESITDDVTAVFAAVATRATPDDLAAASERYGLSPTETVEHLSSAGHGPATIVPVAILRADGDLDAAHAAVHDVLGLSRRVFDAAAVADTDQVVPLRPPLASANASLLAALGPPQPSPVHTGVSVNADLLAALGEPAPAADMSSNAALLAALDNASRQPDSGALDRTGVTVPAADPAGRAARSTTEREL